MAPEKAEIKVLSVTFSKTKIERSTMHEYTADCVYALYENNGFTLGTIEESSHILTRPIQLRYIGNGFISEPHNSK